MKKKKKSKSAKGKIESWPRRGLRCNDVAVVNAGLGQRPWRGRGPLLEDVACGSLFSRFSRSFAKGGLARKKRAAMQHATGMGQNRWVWGNGLQMGDGRGCEKKNEAISVARVALDVS